MNGFERRRQEKTGAILKAALDLFTARGVKAVTVTDIARRARVSHVTIYNYFGSKDNLAKQVFFALMDQKTKEAEELLAGPLSFPEKLTQLFRLKTEMLATPSLEFFRRVYLTDPDVQRLLKEYYETKSIPLLVGLIEEGKREGSVNPALSTSALRLYTDFFWQGLTRPEVYAALDAQTSTDLYTLFFYGLMGRPGGGNG
ncbi:MAG: TetR/AcrR family transcriptional regulator [Betaproteobacteria bacterium]